ncbi:MAG: hypothetical protein UY54_C0005G0001 [Parcubacteria group bacterium GW2011_GWA2_50_10b]|nr:MAG: hypothetical protein UY54_C0005G0001 [Parcubacteria group bacterium GW2011_GWA2_50_10b]
MFSIFMLIPVILILVLVLAGVGVASFINRTKSNNMDPNQRTAGSAQDFFLHVGALITFYTSAIALITILFEAIDYAYPKVVNVGYYGAPSISFQVAILIVAFPIFLLFAWLLQRSYIKEPALREAPVRKWLSFITLAIAGGVMAGDLITVLYMYLDGQDFTTGFLLKVLALVVIAGAVFLYYLREIKNLISAGERNVWRVVGVVIVVGSILIGFSVLGSPAKQRQLRYDNQRVTDLQNIQWQIINYWQQKGILPNTLAETQDSISGFKVPMDPKTKTSYQYRLTGPTSFELCATFDQPTLASRSSAPYQLSYPMGKIGENWEHEAGRQCFERTIDPELYPPTKSLR